MATIFTRIIDGEIPSRMIWEDDLCVSFLDVRPLAPGHCLVVPRVEVDQWTDLDADLTSHLTTVAHTIGQTQKTVFKTARVGLLIAGFEVPHVHLHVVPIDHMSQLEFANANTSPDPSEQDGEQTSLREALTAAGHNEVSNR